MAEAYLLERAEGSDGEVFRWTNSSGASFEAGLNFRGDFYLQKNERAVFSSYSEPGHGLFAAVLGYLKSIEQYPSKEELFEGTRSEERDAVKDGMQMLDMIFHDVVHTSAQVNRTDNNSPIRAKCTKEELQLSLKGETLVTLDSQDAVLAAKSIALLTYNRRPYLMKNLETIYLYGLEADISKPIPDLELLRKIEEKFA